MKVAFIGLGDIGLLMASHLAREPFELVVWNRTPSKSEDFARSYKARVAESPAAAAQGADVVITCLPSSVEVEAVLHGESGILDAMRKGSVLIDCTSGDPPTSRSIAAELGGRGVEFIDAPVSGSVGGAISRTLAVMVGAKAEDASSFEPLLHAIGSHVFYLGELGRGNGSGDRLDGEKALSYRGDA